MKNRIFFLALTLFPIIATSSNILVTGGVGFIGGHLVERLIQRGDNVTIIDNFNSDYLDPAVKRKNAQLLQQLPNASTQLRIYEADLRDKDKLTDLYLLIKPDIICHLGACGSVQASVQHPELSLTNDIATTLNLLELAKQYGLKNFVFASSSSIYGDNEKIPFEESDQVNRPCSPYAASKRMIELMLATYNTLYNIPATCLRFFNVYGPNVRRDAGAFKFLDAIMRHDTITIYGDGSMSRDFVYVADVVDGIVAAADNPHAYEIFNIGSGDSTSLNDFIATVEHVSQKKAIIQHVPVPSGEAKRTHSDITKIKNALGWEPKIGLIEGVQRTHDWYLKQ